MAFRSGELDKRVTFKSETLTPDGMGGNTLSWTNIVTTWAHVRPLSGGERENADRVQSPANYLFVVRSYSETRSVTENDKITWNGTDFNIRFIRDRGVRPLFLEFEAEKAVAQ